jgi:hypothetical protein
VHEGKQKHLTDDNYTYNYPIKLLANIVKYYLLATIHYAVKINQSLYMEDKDSWNESEWGMGHGMHCIYLSK